MKKFFISLTVFLLPFVVVFIFLEVKLRDIPNSYNQKKQLIAKHVNEIEVLVVGSSHTLYAVDPTYFTHKGFNLANISQTPYYDYRIVEKYIDDLPKLKLVVIPVSYLTFFKQLVDGQEDWRSYFYEYYWDIEGPGSSVFDFNKYSLSAIYTSYVVMTFARHGFTNPGAPIYNTYGAECRDSVGHLQNISDEQGMVRVTLFNKDYNEENYKNGVHDYRMLLQLLKSRHIAAVFISTPVFHTFLDNCEPEILQRNERQVRVLCEEFGCRFFDFANDSRFAIDDFSDNDHLNFVGAKKFSKILDTEVITPVVKHYSDDMAHSGFSTRY